MTHLINNTCFQLLSIKKKRKHGTYNVKTNVGKHNAWCLKRIWKYSMNLLITKKTDVRDNTTRPHLHVIALLRFHIVKKQHMYISLNSLFPFFHIILYYIFISFHSDNPEDLYKQRCANKFALDQFVSLLLHKWFIFSSPAHCAHLCNNVFSNWNMLD